MLLGLGDLELESGNRGEARRWYEEALDLHRRSGDSLAAGHMALRLGRLLARQDTETARRYYGAALELYAKAESGRWQAIARDELDKLGGEDP